MYALIMFEKVFIFDLMAYYGLFYLNEVNLNGYVLIEDYKSVLLHYKDKYFNKDIGDIEQLFDFLFRICVNYLKEFLLL